MPLITFFGDPDAKDDEPDTIKESGHAFERQSGICVVCGLKVKGMAKVPGGDVQPKWERNGVTHYGFPAPRCDPNLNYPTPRKGKSRR